MPAGLNFPHAAGFQTTRYKLTTDHPPWLRDVGLELPHRRMYAAEACRSRVGFLGFRTASRRRLCQPRRCLRRLAARLVDLRLTPFCRSGAFRFGLTLPLLVHSFVVPQQGERRLIRIDRAKGAVPVPIAPIVLAPPRARMLPCPLGQIISPAAWAHGEPASVPRVANSGWSWILSAPFRERRCRRRQNFRNAAGGLCRKN